MLLWQESLAEERICRRASIASVDFRGLGWALNCWRFVGLFGTWDSENRVSTGAGSISHGARRLFPNVS